MNFRAIESGGTMFGHQDHPGDNNQPVEPASSGTLSNDSVMPGTAPPVTPPANDLATNDYIAANEPSVGSMPTTPVSQNDGDLLQIKQQALQQLSPLVGHLDQSPEEKFRTTMMMIQGSDDQSLIPIAYEAAQAITDEKAKAQALLDVVNEINYFTHPQANEEQKAAA